MVEVTGTAKAVATKILLVDDDDEVRRVLTRVLEKKGYRVVPCASGSEALEQLQGGAYDAMVSDIRMPGMDGLALLGAVREHDLDLPVILMTGAPDVESATKAVEFGAFKYLCKPVESQHLVELVERASSVGRMARIKREYVEQFGSGMFRIGDRAGLSAILERTLSSLWVAFQPIVYAGTHDIFAYEALMRSVEPDLPHPGAVLNAAERTDKLRDVGRVVRELVALSAHATSDRSPIFVNLHPQDLQDPSLYAANSPLAALAPRIVLEITERASLEQVRDIRGRVARLREMGFRIALDDLGAGYAGLTSFTQLEPEFVKLDMELIRGIHQQEMKQKIVRSLVQLCHDMGKLIIAEGIESIEESDVLEGLDCDLLQGFYFARPRKSLAIAV